MRVANGFIRSRCGTVSQFKRVYVKGRGSVPHFGYLDRLGQPEGWLAVFDRYPAVSWEAKLTWQTLTRDGKTIHVVGL